MVSTICGLSKQNPYQLIRQLFGHVSITRLILIERKGFMEGLPENIPDMEETCPTCLLTKAKKNPRGPTLDVSKFAPGFMIHMIFCFSMLKASVGLPRLLWLYVLLLHTSLGLHPESNGRLLTS